MITNCSFSVILIQNKNQYFEDYICGHCQGPKELPINLFKLWPVDVLSNDTDVNIHEKLIN